MNTPMNTPMIQHFPPYAKLGHIMVAAGNSLYSQRRLASFVCPGDEDDADVIIQAVDSLPGTNWDNNKSGGAGAVDHVPGVVYEYDADFYRQTRLGTVEFTAGTFNVVKSLPLVSGLFYKGQGAGRATALQFTGTPSDVNMFEYATTRNAGDDIRTWCGIYDMLINGRDLGTGRGIANLGDGLWDMKLGRIFVENFVTFEEAAGDDSDSAIVSNQCWGHVYDDVTIEFNTGNGLAVLGGSSPKICNSKIGDNSKNGCVFRSGAPFITNSEFWACGEDEASYANEYAGIVFWGEVGSGASLGIVAGCRFVLNYAYTHGIRIHDTGKISVFGNTFTLGTNRVGVLLSRDAVIPTGVLIGQNIFATATASQGIGVKVESNAGSATSLIGQNIFDSSVLTPISDASGIVTVKDNIGSARDVTKTVVLGSADGSETIFTVAHGLPSTLPTYADREAEALPMNEAAAAAGIPACVFLDGTNAKLEFATAPPAANAALGIEATGRTVPTFRILNDGAAGADTASCLAQVRENGSVLATLKFADYPTITELATAIELNTGWTATVKNSHGSDSSYSLYLASAAYQDVDGVEVDWSYTPKYRVSFRYRNYTDAPDVVV